MLIDFREREKERESEEERCERETSISCLWYAPNWGWTCNLGRCPDRESNPWTFGVLDDAPTKRATPTWAAVVFLMWLLDLATLLNSLLTCSGIAWHTFLASWFCCQGKKKKESLVFPIFIIHSLCLAKTSNNCWIIVMITENPCLILDFQRNNTKVSPLNVIFSVDL